MKKIQKRQIVVFITDCVDIAFSEIRAALYNVLNDHSYNIEPVVKVIPFSLINTSFILRLLADQYPEGTIFSVIVNPIRERTERIFGQTIKKNQFFFATNTGAVEWLIKDFGCFELYEVNDPGFLPFGGKYVHAPAVGKFVAGLRAEEIGKPFPIEKIRKLEIKEGTILHIDNFGLMKFMGKLEGLTDGDKLEVSVNKKKINAVYTKRMMAKEDGDWVLYPGSSLDLPELGMVRANGAESIKAKVGDIITFKKI
jgi:S-adenosylmethionine hydrolase